MLRHREQYDWLPGRLLLARGSVAEYESLARFHYVAGRPATFALILVVRYFPPAAAAECRTVAVGVLSHPPLRCHQRERAMGWGQMDAGLRVGRVNREFRTISRIIVHPQFRGLGLAGHLVRALAALAATPCVESIAQMGRVHPLFTRAGFRAAQGGGYFLRRFASSGGSRAGAACQPR